MNQATLIDIFLEQGENDGTNDGKHVGKLTITGDELVRAGQDGLMDAETVAQWWNATTIAITRSDKLADRIAAGCDMKDLTVLWMHA